MRLPASVAGFAPDSFSGLTDHHLSGHRRIALNVDFTHVVSVAGASVDDFGVKCTSAASDTNFGGESAWVRPLGFVDRRVTPGMSSGPIIDLQCRVIGIA